MNAAQVYFKTDKALEEIKTKKYKLKPKIRNLLFLIDGHKSVSAVNEMSQQLGVSDVDLLDLQNSGFIIKSSVTESANAAVTAAATPPMDEAARFRVAKQYMNDTIVNSLGLKAFFFTLKLEKAGNRADLAEMLEAYGEALAKAADAPAANLLVRRARELLQ